MGSLVYHWPVSENKQQTDPFVDHLPEFIEEGTLHDNPSIDDDLPFEDSVELNLEEGTGLKRYKQWRSSPFIEMLQFLLQRAFFS